MDWRDEAWAVVDCWVATEDREIQACTTQEGEKELLGHFLFVDVAPEHKIGYF